MTLILVATGVITGCTSVRETSPARTATEQLLFSAAADRVCRAIALQIPADNRVYVETGYADLEDADTKYLVASLRDRILREGGRLVNARDRADLVLEPRIGAHSVDRKKLLVGIPAIPIPVPLAGTIDTPQLALFGRDRRQGVVKLALTSYHAATGALAQSLEPVYGFSHRTEWVALIFFKWQTNDLVPDPANDDWVGEGSFD